MPHEVGDLHVAWRVYVIQSSTRWLRLLAVCRTGGNVCHPVAATAETVAVVRAIANSKVAISRNELHVHTIVPFLSVF